MEQIGSFSFYKIFLKKTNGHSISVTRFASYFWAVWTFINVYSLVCFINQGNKCQSERVLDPSTTNSTNQKTKQKKCSNVGYYSGSTTMI